MSRLILPKFRGRGVVVHRTAAVAIVSGVTTTMTWSAAVYDPESMWNGTQTFTPPADVKFVKLAAFIQWATSGAGIRNAEIQKSGVLSLVSGRVFDQQVAQAATARNHNLQSAMVDKSLDVPTYFTRVQQTSGGNLNVQIGSWFAMWVIE